jgi:hypothetical protein
VQSDELSVSLDTSEAPVTMFGVYSVPPML